MALFLSLLTYLLIITWPCLLLLSYTMFSIRTRFVLQTLFILPNCILCSLICYIFGLMVKYLTFNMISSQFRQWLLSFTTQQFWQFLLFGLEFWPNLKYIVSDENIDCDIFYLNTIILCNHSETPFDWIGLASIADYLDRFQNSFVFMKKEFAFVPAVGWIGSLNTAISLQRDWNKDKIKIKSLCNQFKKGKNGLYKYLTPWCWFFYPEGTRFNQKKLKQAKEFAKQRGFPIYNHLLQPRVKGFSYLTHHLYDVLGCIIDTTCLYHPFPPNPYNFFIKTRLSKYIHIHLRVYRQKDIPFNIKDLDQWIRNRWTEKDDILNNMKENKIKYKILKRSPFKAIRYYIFWTIIIIYLLFNLIFNIQFILFCIILISALFPVIIVIIEQSQNMDKIEI